MMKKLKKTDLFFVLALLLGLLVHSYFISIIPFSQDESFYLTIPFRILNGDSLVQHEWHLTQFSSLFSYLPVYIWTSITGSTDSIFLFSRCTYLVIHTAIAVVIYIFFRKYGNWAIMASMIFYIQIAYRIQAISYQSVLVISLLILSLCLISIFQKSSVKSYVFAGICFGCCCVCNPFFCIEFAVYLFICALWTKRQVFVNHLIKTRSIGSSKKQKGLTKKQKRQLKQQQLEAFPNLENYNCFFSKEAVLWISCGVLVVAVIAVVFFFSTGGTVSSIEDNIENLLGSSEYDIASKSVFFKFIDTLKYFSMANLGIPWILPLIFSVLLFDKKRKHNIHRFAYLTISIFWSAIFMFATLKEGDYNLFAVSLPFCVISTLCYILTENKNKTLFYCMYIPCLIATFIQYLAADTHLAAIGVILAVNNVAGVFFSMDLWKEMRSVSQNELEATNKKNTGLLRGVIIVSFCLQILFYGLFYQFEQVNKNNAVKASVGPYSGLYMTEQQLDRYNKLINDMDVIKKLSENDDPILIDSYGTWMYLYLERPVATYMTWYLGTLEPKQLTNYYRESPEKIPKYIYFESPDPKKVNIQVANELFEFTREDLSRGVLLTVEGCKF